MCEDSDKISKNLLRFECLIFRIKAFWRVVSMFYKKANFKRWPEAMDFSSWGSLHFATKVAVIVKCPPHSAILVRQSWFWKYAIGQRKQQQLQGTCTKVESCVIYCAQLSFKFSQTNTTFMEPYNFAFSKLHHLQWQIVISNSPQLIYSPVSLHREHKNYSIKFMQRW